MKVILRNLRRFQPKNPRFPVVIQGDLVVDDLFGRGLVTRTQVRVEIPEDEREFIPESAFTPEGGEVNLMFTRWSDLPFGLTIVAAHVVHPLTLAAFELKKVYCGGFSAAYLPNKKVMTTSPGNFFPTDGELKQPKEITVTPGSFNVVACVTDRASREFVGMRRIRREGGHDEVNPTNAAKPIPFIGYIREHPKTKDIFRLEALDRTDLIQPKLLERYISALGSDYGRNLIEEQAESVRREFETACMGTI